MPNVTDRQIISALNDPKTMQQAAKELGISVSRLRKRMKALGLKPWGKIFARGYRVHCSDGHIVDSFGEREVDNWLNEQKFKHKVHKRLVGTDCYIDFWLPDYGIGLEYVGVEGVPEYQQRIEQKKRIYEYWNIPVVFITPKTPLDASLIKEITLVMREYRKRKKETQAILRK